MLKNYFLKMYERRMAETYNLLKLDWSSKTFQ